MINYIDQAQALDGQIIEIKNHIKTLNKLSKSEFNPFDAKVLKQAIETLKIKRKELELKLAKAYDLAFEEADFIAGAFED